MPSRSPHRVRTGRAGLALLIGLAACGLMVAWATSNLREEKAPEGLKPLGLPALPGALPPGERDAGSEPGPSLASKERAVAGESPRGLDLEQELEPWLEDAEASIDLPAERHLKDPVPGLSSESSKPVQRGYHEDGQLAWEAHGRRFGDEWVRHGRWRKIHPNGSKHESGEYWRGVEHGPWNWWYEDGRPMAQGHFERGQRQGIWLFYREHGEGLMAQGTYLDGQGHGPWVSYDEEGRVATRGSLEDGEYEGYWEVYAEGELDLDRSGSYRAGVRLNGE